MHMTLRSSYRAEANVLEMRNTNEALDTRRDGTQDIDVTCCERDESFDLCRALTTDARRAYQAFSSFCAGVIMAIS